MSEKKIKSIAEEEEGPLLCNLDRKTIEDNKLCDKCRFVKICVEVYAIQKNEIRAGFYRSPYKGKLLKDAVKFTLESHFGGSTMDRYEFKMRIKRFGLTPCSIKKAYRLKGDKIYKFFAGAVDDFPGREKLPIQLL